MFGMGKEKGKQGKGHQVTPAEFDLEKDLKNPSQLRAVKEKLETRVQQLKTAMRGGGDKEEFDQAQVLLHGYLACQKVVSRVNRKMM